MALPNHDHSGSKNDHGGTFDAANLTSGTATDGHVLTADGSGGAAWEVLPDIAAGDVDSGTATAGQALIADGAGGADWGDPGTGFEANLLASTGEAAGAIIVADGADGADWDTLTVGLVDAEASTAGQVMRADGAGAAAWDNLVAADLDAGASTDGQVLTSDGAGAAAWESIPVQIGIPVAVTADWATAGNAWADIKTATGMTGRVGADAAVATIIFHIWEGSADSDDFGRLEVADDVASWPATGIMASYPTEGTVYLMGFTFSYAP